MQTAPQTQEEISAPEQAAVDLVDAIATCAQGMGIAKWQMLQARVRIAAIRSDNETELWGNLVPHLRSVSDWIDNPERRARIHSALNTPGVLGVLRDHLDLTFLRVRVARDTKKPVKASATTNQGKLL